MKIEIVENQKLNKGSVKIWRAMENNEGFFEVFLSNKKALYINFNNDNIQYFFYEDEEFHDSVHSTYYKTFMDSK